MASSLRGVVYPDSPRRRTRRPRAGECGIVNAMPVRRTPLALLVVSFGTSYHETYHKTIEAIENDLKAAFPEADFFHAYTSKMIIGKLKKRDGIAMDTPVEALEKIKAGGYAEVLCQATHIINGHEFYRMIREMRPYQDVFERFIVRRPLLSSRLYSDTFLPISVFSGDKLGHIAKALNQASAYLQTSRSELKREVAKRMEAEKQIRYLTRRLVDGNEEERKRLGHDLHDEFGQSAVGNPG